jgi:class 3 adenylate cyclase
VNFQRAYFSRLLSLPLLDLGVSGIFILITQRYSMILLVASGLLLLSLSVLLAGYFLYRPILAFEKNLETATDAIKQAAHTRLRRLSWYSAIATFVLTMIYIFSASALRVYTPVDAPLDHIDTLTITKSLVWYSTVFGFFYAYFVYFVVNGLVIKMRRRYHMALEAFSAITVTSRPRLARKLTVLFIVIGIMPALLVGLDLTIFAPIRALQGLSTGQVIALDLICTLYVVVVSIVFVSHSLLAPIEELYRAQDAVQQGDYQHQAAVLTDDELGDVTNRFNLMTDALRERELMKSALSRYLTPSVATELIRQGGIIAPRSAEASVMFTDIDGFTTIAETLTPEETIELLNLYFAVLNDIIGEAGGVINNFIGDAVVAIFNVPVTNINHARAAVTAALAISHAAQHQLFTLASGRTIKLPTRIGINTGPVCAGTIGARERQGYTVYGDAVNLAARIEPMNKQFNTRILASERTVTLAREQGLDDTDTTWLKIANIPVAGRHQAVTLYELSQPSVVLRNSRH